MGEYTKAEIFNKELCELSADIANRNFSFMSERQRDLYWATMSDSFEVSYSLAHAYPVSSVNVLNYNNTLFTKGLLLRTTNAVRDAIYGSGNASLVAQYEELQSIREQISVLQQKDDAGRDYLQSLESEAEILDKALARESAAFRDLKADMALQWQDVAQSLSPEDAALEFVSFQLYDKKWTDQTLYAALVLRPGMEAPAWVPLCEETALADILSRAEGRPSAEQARIIYDVFGAQLYDTVWKPLEAALAGVKTVYYAPSGLLHKIAFNAIPAPPVTGGGERLSDVYDLNLVSSTREVARFTRSGPEARPASAVLYGGLHYSADAETMRAAAEGVYAAQDAPVLAAALPAGLTRGAAWGELPATREETAKIKSYLDERHIGNTLYGETLGNEESFKALSGAKTGLLHLATHGFFLADIERRSDEREGMRAQNKPKTTDNPLLRSGLLLSGSNHAWTGEKIEGVEDGILTADEIARLNLIDTRLVVLSACQTGLGDVKNGEGVFGLQRAFKLAGVETLIMSLWEVDDAATAKLMSTFYREWLSGKSKRNAFKEAQAAVRAEYSAPFYWAAFVMMD